MKSIFTFICFILTFSFGISQEHSETKKDYSIKDVKDFAVYPGCEKFSDNAQLLNCFSEKINQLLPKKLKRIQRKLLKNDVIYARANVLFIVSKEGEIVFPKITEGFNEEFNVAVIDAFKSLSKEIPKIEPAKLEDGTAVNLIFQMPVIFSLDENPVEISTESFVLFTLVDENLIYEIRLNENQSLHAFEFKNETYTFLGKFSNLNELSQSEPYRALILEEIETRKNYVAEGEIEGQLYRIYIHNLFKPSKENPIYIEVQKITSTGAETIETFRKETEFMKSPYALLVYRT